MNQQSEANRQRRGTAWLAGALAAMFVTASAEAAPIISYAAVSTGTTTGTSFGPAWQKFLAGGPALWAVESPPPFPSHIRLATDNGLIVETPFVEYLIWRRDLDPARFDHFHPIIGPILGTLPQTLVPPSVPQPPTVPVPSLFNAPPPPPVPEPPMLPLALTLVGAAIAYQRRRAGSA
jgi:hypothetical protein